MMLCLLLVVVILGVNGRAIQVLRYEYMLGKTHNSKWLSDEDSFEACFEIKL